MNVKKTIQKHLSDNKKLYVILAFFFMLGLLAGSLAVPFINPQKSSKVAEEIKKFFSIYTLQGADSKQLFLASLKNNIRVLAVIAICGFFVFGSVGIILQIFLRGFLLGFSITFLTSNYFLKGFLFSLCSLLPQNLIFLPAALIYATLAMSNASRAVKERKSNKKQLMKFCTVNLINFSIFLCISVICSLIEAYVMPLFIVTIPHA